MHARLIGARGVASRAIAGRGDSQARGHGSQGAGLVEGAGHRPGGGVAVSVLALGTFVYLPRSGGCFPEGVVVGEA